MIVHYMATYYLQWAHENLAPRSQDQWYSFKFCRAVKNGRINGSLIFPWANKPETINEQSVAWARLIFGLFIQHALGVSGVLNPILVPVPSKDGLIGAADSAPPTAGALQLAATVSRPPEGRLRRDWRALAISAYRTGRGGGCSCQQ
jgi:hypothetical protein